MNKEDDRIQKFLREFDIPLEAVEIIETEITLPAYFDEILKVNYVEKLRTNNNNEVSSTQLSDLIRPTIGGMLMQNKRVYSGSTYVRNCTFGFNAKWNGQNVFITNSHCTENASPVSQLWEEDANLSFHLPHQFDSPTNQGLEVLDPYGTVSNCPNNHKCRKSDAAVIQFLNINSSDIGMAKIAKTTSRGNNWTDGSSTLLTNNSEFRIIDQDKTILINMPLNKVGVATGWTHGYVSNTCVTDYIFFGSNKDLKCSYYVSGMKASFGDSGSPVFYEHTTPSGDAQLVGILYGVRSSEQKAAFSPIFGIESDLGVLEASDLPISVSINGSSLIDSPGNYIWNASVNNQNAAVSYQWQIKWSGSSSYSNLGSNSSQTVNVSNEINFILKLIVSDAYDSDDDIHSVSVNFEGCSPSNPCGF